MPTDWGTSSRDAAFPPFGSVRFEKAQVEEIAEAAGFGKGALYAHFKSHLPGKISPRPGQGPNSRGKNRRIPEHLHRLVE
jgi:hypothetical protein